MQSQKPQRRKKRRGIDWEKGPPKADSGFSAFSAAFFSALCVLSFSQEKGRTSINLLVPSKGLEPPHRCRYMDLNHARLPIPPRWQCGRTHHGSQKAAASGRPASLFYRREPHCQTSRPTNHSWVPDMTGMPHVSPMLRDVGTPSYSTQIFSAFSAAFLGALCVRRFSHWGCRARGRSRLALPGKSHQVSARIKPKYDNAISAANVRHGRRPRSRCRNLLLPIPSPRPS